MNDKCAQTKVLVGVHEFIFFRKNSKNINKLKLSPTNQTLNIHFYPAKESLNFAVG